MATKETETKETKLIRNKLMIRLKIRLQNAKEIGNLDVLCDAMTTILTTDLD